MEAKAKHAPPTREEDEHIKKKQKTVEEPDRGFAFNQPIYSNHKIIIKHTDDEGEVTEETIHVAKLVCATESPMFKKLMEEEDETVLELSSEFTIDHMKDLLRWMYVNHFESKGPDLCSVMALAHTYQIERAVRQCASALAEDMTAEHACAYLAQEAATKDKENVFPGLKKLWKEAGEYIQQEFREINIQTLTSEKFLGLTVEGIKAILSSETVHIGTENTIFAAFRLWLHRDFEGRKKFAAQLLPLIRFTQIRQDYLLDVVKKEGEASYPEDAKKIYARKIIEAYVYHSTSADRREALRLVTEVPRPYDELLLKETFYWKAENFSELKELWSLPFFLGGYFLHLLLQRKNVNGPGGGTLGLYLHIKVDAGLSPEFYVPLAFELLVKNQRTGKFFSPKGAYASPFTAQNKAWGYVDILNTTWEDFFKEGCPFNSNGCLEVKANIWFKDYWDQLKRDATK